MSVRIFILIALVIISCSKDDAVISPKPKGSRQVGIHITQAESNSYDIEFTRSKALGMDVVPFTLIWNTLETDAGFDFSLLDIINTYYPAKNAKVSINFSPIYAINRGMPSDLQSKEFNDPLVISRFKTLLDSVHKKLDATQVNNFIVGLEVDLYLNSHPAEWNKYKAFYDSAVVHIKKVWGNDMKVGVETTWSSAALDSKDNIISLNEKSDMMVLSYYPNESDFTVKAPTAIHNDIETIIGLYPGIQIFIVETGYQTSAACNSSEEMQKQFIIEMFKLWDNHINKINFIGFLWLTDLSDADVNKYVVDYGATGFPYLDAFKGYLKTTGLRTYPGTGMDKLGFTQLKMELEARGW